MRSAFCFSTSSGVHFMNPSPDLKPILPYLADNHEPSKCLAEMLARGDNGFKTGKGWQEWTPEQIKASNTGLREYLIDYIAEQKKKGK